MSTQVSDQISGAPIGGLGNKRSLPKRGIDVYTMMLIVAFMCMLIASILMFVEWGKWDNDTGPTPGGAATAPQTPQFAAAASLESTCAVDQRTG